jgi:anti-anti-sigma factor
VNGNSRSITFSPQAAAAGRDPHVGHVSVLLVEGALHGPLGAELRRGVQTLLQRGARRIALCLARVSSVDAAGIGELVRAHNIVAAANGRLRITNTPQAVRIVLDRLGLFDVLSSDLEPDASPRRNRPV